MTIQDLINDKENQLAIFQDQISGLQAEIEALRIAVQIIERGHGVETAGPVAVQTPVAAGGDKKKKKSLWP
jgi:hypothetical protein